MSGAVDLCFVLSQAVTWLANEYLLVPNKLEYLQTITFILVIAALVQFVETVLKKLMPSLYKSLGVYLPLITTNCAVLGSALIFVERDYTFVESVVFGFAAGLGFTLALILFSGVRERLETADIPEAFKGMPITLIAASLVSITFIGFAGLIIS